jgi:hypothetical protein
MIRHHPRGVIDVSSSGPLAGQGSERFSFPTTPLCLSIESGHFNNGPDLGGEERQRPKLV